MNYLLAYLPDPYLQEMAEYFARAASAVAAARVARSQQGDAGAAAKRSRPAAIRDAAFRRARAATGRRSRGMEPGIPGLLGLRASLRQRAARRAGATARGTATAGLHAARRGPSHRSDITAVAAWLATRPPPADPVPASDGTSRCRSLRQPAELTRRSMDARGLATCCCRSLLALCLRRPRPRSAVGKRRRNSASSPRRIPRARRRLHRLPHRAGGQAVRRRARRCRRRSATLYTSEHHARSGDRHRQVDARTISTG